MRLFIARWLLPRRWHIIEADQLDRYVATEWELGDLVERVVMRLPGARKCAKKIHRRLNSHV